MLGWVQQQWRKRVIWAVDSHLQRRTSRCTYDPRVSKRCAQSVRCRGYRIYHVEPPYGRAATVTIEIVQESCEMTVLYYGLPYVQLSTSRLLPTPSRSSPTVRSGTSIITPHSSASGPQLGSYSAATLSIQLVYSLFTLNVYPVPDLRPHIQ